MNSPEHNEQRTLFAWISLMEAQIPALKNAFAIPNGGHRHIAVATKMKAEGVKAGVPDIFLAVPMNYETTFTAGLFIEMKSGKNKTTPAQNEWISRLEKAGYLCVVCYSFEEAQREILAYLELEE
jgi:hypothetical protein